MLKIVEVGSQERFDALRAVEDHKHDYLYICHYCDSIKLSNNGVLHNFVKLQVCETQSAYDSIVNKESILYIVQRSTTEYALYFGNVLIKTGAGGDVPTIGANGNWFLGDVDTGVRAAGVDGKPGTRTYKYHVILFADEWDSNDTQVIYDAHIRKDNCHYIIAPTTEHLQEYGDCEVYAEDVTVDGEITFKCYGAPRRDLDIVIVQMELDTSNPSISPNDISIGANGNWYLGEDDTGFKATPTKGVDYFTAADKQEIVQAVVNALKAEGLV